MPDYEATFHIDQNILNGYPSYSELGNFSDNQIKSDYMFDGMELEGYPSMFGSFTNWNTNSNYIFKTTDIKYLEGYPYLKGQFIIPNHWLCVYLFSPDKDYVEGYPTLGPKKFEQFGVGKDSEIEEVEIPNSITYIADWAFYNSGIKKVRINRHCIYFEHSFPPGCIIKPYK